MLRRHLRTVVLASLGFVAAGAWTSAQLYRPEPVTPPVLVSGPDVGFRIESRRGDDIHGRLVVRVDGEWVEVKLSDPTAVRRLGSN